MVDLLEESIVVFDTDKRRPAHRLDYKAREEPFSDGRILCVATKDINAEDVAYYTHEQGAYTDHH